MLQRLIEGKVVDTIEFCKEKKELKDPSTDPLASKENIDDKKDLIFGVKTTSWQFYTHHYYADEIFYDVRFLSYNTVRNYIAGYYGIDPIDIENFDVNKKENKITFSIAAQPQHIEKLQRNQYISVFMSQLNFINSNNPKHEVSTGKQGKLLSVSFTTANNLSPNSYQDIFNQIPIGYIKIKNEAFCVCSVKVNDKIKGFKNYPVKYYVRLPYFTTPHLVIHLIRNYSILIIFNQNKLQVQCELLPETQQGINIITEETIMKILTDFLKIEYQPFTHIYYNFKYQYSYKDPLQTFYKKMRELKFLSPRKTHGFQYDVQGLLIEEITELPLVNITYFQQQEIAQIDIYAVNNIDIINLNVLIFKNYFGFQEQDLDYSISGIKELQLVDPVQFGQDDRYDYERLVNDVRKRPFYQNIQFGQQQDKEQILITIDEATKKYEPKDTGGNIDDQSKDNTVGGAKPNTDGIIGMAKGSSVYTQQYDQELIDAFIKFQERLSRGFTIRNQTYGKDEIYTQYQCHNKFYINLSQTNGKIAISCTNEKINTDGIGIYGFYDIAKKILKGTDNIKNIRKILMGRVSISAIKYTQWVLSGRCAELSVQLAQLFGSDNLMLALLYHSPQVYSTREQNQYEIIDEEWFTSVFGKSREELGDGEIIYSPETDKFFISNLQSKNPLVYIQFQYGQKYLLIKDDLLAGPGNTKFYIPYRISDVRLKSIKPLQQPQLPYINTKFMTDIKYYYYCIPLQQYFVVLKSTGQSWPYIGDLFNIKKETEIAAPKWPSYDDVKKASHLSNFDVYYINYKKQYIGASQSGIYYFWQATTDIKINTNISTIKLSTYPVISNSFYNKSMQKRYVAVDTKKIVCHLFAKYYYLHNTIPNSITAKSVIKIAQSMNQLGKEPIIVTNAIGDTIYYLSTFTMKQIDDGMELLLPALPKQQGLVIDYILQNAKLSRYNNDYFLASEGEEIYHYRPQGL